MMSIVAALTLLFAGYYWHWVSAHPDWAFGVSDPQKPPTVMIPPRANVPDDWVEEQRLLKQAIENEARDAELIKKWKEQIRTYYLPHPENEPADPLLRPISIGHPAEDYSRPVVPLEEKGARQPPTVSFDGGPQRIPADSNRTPP